MRRHPTTSPGRSLTPKGKTAMNPDIAVDAPLENRPGVPREKRPPEAMTAPPRPSPLREGEVEILVEPTRAGRTPVFASVHPPRGLSGALRRTAYRLPDYRVRRWLLLLVADRVDAQESRVRRLFGRPLAFSVAGLMLASGWPP